MEGPSALLACCCWSRAVWAIWARVLVLLLEVVVVGGEVMVFVGEAVVRFAVGR